MPNECLEFVSCRSCGAPDEQVILLAKDTLYGAEGIYRVVRCTRCGLMRTNPRPRLGVMSQFYPSTYGPHKIRVSSAPAVHSGSRKLALLEYIRHAFGVRSCAIPTIRPGKALEIGCSSGAFLARLRDLGWDVHGVEPSIEAARHAVSLGLPVSVGQLESLSDLGGEYDLIVGWMVLEHLHDPVLCLTKLRALSKRDGYLAISIPDAGSADFSLFRKHWYALQVPTHLHHFERRTLSQVLLQAGWRVERVMSQRTVANWIGSLGIALESYGFKRIGQACLRLLESERLTARITILGLGYVFAIFGQTGRITVWARPVEPASSVGYA